MTKPDKEAENKDLEWQFKEVVKDNDYYQAANQKLEKENTELKEKLKDVEKVRDYWKDSSFDWRHKCLSRTSFKTALKAQEQLRKAKGIIRDLLGCLHSVEYDRVSDLEEAEQFLKEDK